MRTELEYITAPSRPSYGKLSSNELKHARHTAFRLKMSEDYGISTSNIPFNASKTQAVLYMDTLPTMPKCWIPDQYVKELLAILKDNPTTDNGLMRTNVPTEVTEINDCKVSLGNGLSFKTSPIAESSLSGQALDTDQDDSEDHRTFDQSLMDDIDTQLSGSQRIIERLPLYIHDLSRWKKGFDIIKYLRAMKKYNKIFMAACVPESMLDSNGYIRTATTKRKQRVTRRVPRKRSHTHGLLA